MKLEDVDWSILKGAIVTFSTCLILGGLFIGGSYYFKDKMEQEYKRNNIQFQNISRKYLAVDEEEKLIKKYYPRFVELYNGGIIGKEQRLNWLEVLGKSGDELKLPSLSYKVDSQTVFVPEFTAKLGKYKLYSSNMTLEMQLLHEGDLLRLFNLLNQKAMGKYNLKDCSMLKTGKEIDTKSSKSNITVKCTVDWFTIKLASGEEIEV